MKRLFNRFAKGSQDLISRILTIFSFLMIPFYFGFIVYYSIVCYDIFRVIAGCISLCAMIHLNKSL